MKKLFVSTFAVAAVLTAGHAVAADLPSRKGPPPVFLPPPPLWAGFYAGLNAGYGWDASPSVNATGYAISNGLDVPLERTLASASAFGASGSAGANGDGFIGGAQAGYNYQWGGNFVVGFEADIQGSGIRGRGHFIGMHANASDIEGATHINSVFSTVEHEKSVDWLGTARGRLGYLVTPTLLVYATGGLAYGGVRADSRVAQSWGGPDAVNVALLSASSGGSFSDTRVGWTVGGGVEWMFAPNLSLKAEYLYYDLGSVSWNSGFIATFTNQAISPANIVGARSQTRFDGHVARAGVNYHFNWGAPVVASY
jgi:outer membrane immunogenic protein